MTCCCAGSPDCTCHPGTPCKQSCVLVQVQTLDKQIPARISFASAFRGGAFLFAIAPTTIKYLVFAPVAHRRDLNASPPFGGAPPQAILRLWLI